MKQTILYEKCIDMRKIVLMEMHKQKLIQSINTFEKNELSYLINQLEKYQKQLDKLTNIIKNMYFITDKRKQKLCVYPQYIQEKIRSQYWYYYKIVENLNEKIYILKKY